MNTKLSNKSEEHKLSFLVLTLKSLFLGLLLSNSVAYAGTWQALVNQPTFLNPPSQCELYPNAMCAPSGELSLGWVNNINLMTDGSILAENIASDEDGNLSYQEWKLTPDSYGSYVKGTWTRVADLPPGYEPYAFASAVLPDGRVIYEGGEFTGPLFDHNWTAMGAIYDPVQNVWQAVPPPAFFTPANFFYPIPFYGDYGDLVIGVAASVILENGTFMIANPMNFNAALLDPKTLTWTETGRNKFDVQYEEGWTLLPNGKVLTVDTYLADKNGFYDFYARYAASIVCVPPVTCTVPYPTNPTNSEIYNPTTGSWESAGSTIVNLHGTASMGPMVLRPDGTVFAAGTSRSSLQSVLIFGFTSIYDSKTSKWSPGPRFPVKPEGQIGMNHGPASLLPNGNVLLDPSPAFAAPPLYFFEFDGKKLIEQPSVPNAAIDSSLFSMMTVLPTGQILFMDFTTDVEIYTATDRSYNPSWAPVITSAPSVVKPGGSYVIKGLRFNGLSQGTNYGADFQSATNYPLLRITNVKTGHVFYSRTHDHSFMGVASNKPVSTHFDVPINQELGQSKLEVVTNGIPSKSISITVIHQ